MKGRNRLTELRRKSRPPAFDLAVLVLGLVITMTATVAFHVEMSTRDEDRFQNAVTGTSARLEARLASFASLLVSARGLFAASELVTADEFRRFIAHSRSQRDYPGLAGVGYASESGTVVFFEPNDADAIADVEACVTTETACIEAMARARDSGEPTLTPSVVLGANARRTSGFVLFVPVYATGNVPASRVARHQNIAGYVFTPIRAPDLLSGISPGSSRSAVTFDLFDGPPEEGRLIHHGPDQAEGLTTDVALAGGGRTWHARFYTLPAFDRQSGTNLTPHVGGAGVLLSLLLFFVSYGRRRARGALLLQARIFESMEEGVSVADQSGVILLTNPAEDRIFGYESGELVGKHVSVLNGYPPEENSRVVGAVIDALQTRGHWSGEFSNVKKDRTPFVTHARISSLDVSKQRYWVCVQRDVTERKAFETERNRLLTRERAARAEAETANRAKDEFLAMLGHELRNPLAPIATALQLIRLRDRRDERGELDVIERQVRHMIRLVDDLLDMSRIRRGKIRLDQGRVQVAAMVARAVEMASPLFEERAQTLELDVPGDLHVRGDAGRLSQVVANLLTNASKFSDRGGRVAITARAEGSDVSIRVKDDGVGIAPEFVPQVFDLFTQAQRSLDRSQGGLGIGLQLVQRLVEAHGGSVEAHSDGLGRGSEFVVRLPRDRTEPARPAPAEESERAEPVGRPPASKRVLVVDDNEDAAEMLANVLREVGHVVQVAHDGPEALEVAPSFAPDVALLDIGLPVMDGYELAGKLRQCVRSRLMAVTGYGQDRDRARSREAGFERHFVKPLDLEMLFRAIEAPPRPADSV